MPSFSILYPGLQSHTYEPGVLIQDWLHPDTWSVHSSISNEQMKNMYISITLDLLFQSEKLRKCTDRGCYIAAHWHKIYLRVLNLTREDKFLISARLCNILYFCDKKYALQIRSFVQPTEQVANEVTKKNGKFSWAASDNSILSKRQLSVLPMHVAPSPW